MSPDAGVLLPARDRADDPRDRRVGAGGLERMDQIKYAVLEKDGSISIIPV